MATDLWPLTDCANKVTEQLKNPSNHAITEADKTSLNETSKGNIQVPTKTPIQTEKATIKICAPAATYY